MQVERYVIKTLIKAGRSGLASRFIARHVYNEMNNLFNEVDFDVVNKAVSRYLVSHCTGKRGVLVRVRHGVYRLNDTNPRAQQLLFQFAQMDCDVKNLG